MFAQNNFCGVFSSMVTVFFSTYLNKDKMHTWVLGCCLKCLLATTSLFLITVMQ